MVRLHLTRGPDGPTIDRKRSRGLPVRSRDEYLFHLEQYVIERNGVLTIDWDAAGVPPSLRTKVVLCRDGEVQPQVHTAGPKYPRWAR